jgi:hypothetical protein
MSEDDISFYNMKKTSRNKNRRFGINSNKSIKLNVRDLYDLKDNSKFQIENFKDNTKMNKNEENYFNKEKNLKYNVNYSLDKDKRWELIKELEKNEDTLVIKSK